MPLKPWKVLESNHIRTRFRIDKCELANGKMLDAIVMEFRSWANVVAFTKDQKIVMVRQYRHGAGKEFLEFPGGIVEDGEDPLVGAQRELLEETGYKVARIVEVGRLYPNPSMQINQLHCFVAYDAEKVGAQNLDAGEDIEVELHTLEEVLALSKEGNFSHGLNVAVFYQALMYLNRVG